MVYSFWLSFIAIISVIFIYFNKEKNKFSFHKNTYFFVITVCSVIIASLVMDYTGLDYQIAGLTLIIFNLGFYILLVLICNILNFFRKCQDYYEQSKRKNLRYKIDSDSMSFTEARSILNVKEGCSHQEIINAYARLISRNDPVDGGSPYILTKIEYAKKVLLR